MPKVTLPDGCFGLEMADGTKIDGRAGTAEVSPEHARAIDRSWYGSSGVLRGGQQFTLGTKAGQRCTACKRTWNAWSSLCPKCERETVPC